MAVDTGLQQSTGEMIALYDETGGQAVDRIPGLFRAVDDTGSRSHRGHAATGRRRHATTSHNGQPAGFQVIERKTLQRLSRRGAPARPNYLGKDGEPLPVAWPEQYADETQGWMSPTSLGVTGG